MINPSSFLALTVGGRKMMGKLERVTQKMKMVADFSALGDTEGIIRFVAR
jgi:hypothetical protein